MIGSTTSPGITHSEATENPVARARGGMASDRATRMPGPSIASDAEITQLTATATTMFGASAKRDRSDRRGDGDARRGSGSSPRMLPRKRRVTMREPTTRPTSWNGSAMAEAKPAGTLVEAELLLVQQRGERDEPDQGRRRGTAGSTRCVAGSRSSAPFANSRRTTAPSPRWRCTSSLAPIACRSHRPRTGSRSRRAITAKTSVGITKTRNGRAPTERVRQQSGRRAGRRTTPTALAARWVLNTLLRELIG